MKPLNADNPGCTPISSDCIIWQGPDIPCIGLCKGETVSTVVAKLGNELCEVLDILNIDSYDISCLVGTDCSPKDFQALIQLLITKICELEGITPVDSANPNTGQPSGVPVDSQILAGNNVPDAVVAFPAIFQYINPQGDLVTQGQLVDLVTASANRIQTIVSEISTIQLTLENHNIRINDLENAPTPTLNLPNLAPICVLPSSPLVPLDQVVVALEEQFCDLRSATGDSGALYTALLQQCAGLSQDEQLAGVGTMENISGWEVNITNLAQAFSNALLTLCDVRASIKTIQDILPSTTCVDLDINLQGVSLSPTAIKLYFTGGFPLNFSETYPLGTPVTITDSTGNFITVNILIAANLNIAAGYAIDITGTPLNGADNLTVVAPLSFGDGSSTCAETITTTIINTSACAIVTFTETEATIDYSLTYTGGAASVDVVLYDGTGTVQISNQVTVVTGPTPIAGQFIGLISGTQYKVRLEITLSGAPSPTLCPFGSITTTPPACLPPTGTAAVINIT